MDSKKNSNPTLQLAEEESTECSGSSGIGSSDSTSSNSLKDVETFKKCCLDSLGNQEDFMIVESTSTSAENISTINDDDTKYISKRKGAAFKKKIKTNTPNVSLMFENIIDHDSNLITDVTESSKCLSRFQKRKRLSRKNNHDFVDINLSDNSEIESAENSLEPSKFRFSEKNKGQSSFDMLDCSLSTLASTNSVKISSDNDNTSEIRENKFFKKPFDSFLLTNNSATDISTAKVSTHKSTQKNINVNDSPFDNIIHESSMVSVSNNNKTLDNTQVSNVNEISLCSTIEIPSFNRTYDIPPNGNSTQKCDLNDTTVELPINETYTLNDHATSQLNNDVSTKSVDIKDVLSDTYTVESNPNKTLTKPRSILKKTNYTINTSANVSNQSKPSVKKQKFLRNLHLNNVSQDYSFTINDSNTILNEDTINDTKRDDCKKFKLKEISHSEDFEIFDNIISGTQENELLTSKNNDINNSISNTLTAVAGTSNNNDLYNISSKCMENTDELTKQSNVILDEKFENDKSICPTLISCKSNSFSHSGFKFDFNKQFGRHSLSYQDKSMNSSMIVKPHNISLNNSVFDKTLGEKSSTFHKSVDNVNLDSNSQICENPKKHLISQKFQPASISSLPISTTINEEVEENNLELSQNISLKAYQSSEPCFAGKPNINANSVVFSNLIDDSLNDDISLDDSKRIKFKNHKNISVSHSVMFENIITNSQESPNCSINQNKTGQSIPYDNSNIKGDEISVFANSDELLSNNESNSSDHDSKNRSMSNVDKSRLNHSKSESLGGKSSEVSIVNNIMQYEQNNSSVSVESANNYSLSNVASGIMENDSLSKSNKTSHVFPKTSVNNLQKKNSILLNEVTTINERVSDSSTNQNETLTQKIMYNGSKNRGDEISMFAIADELLSIRKSVKRSNKKIDSGKKLNLEKSNTTADEFNILDKKYKDSSSKLSKDDFFQGKISSNISSSHKSHNTHSINSNVSVVGSNIQSEQNNSLSPKKPIIKHPKTSILQCLTRTKACTSNNSLTLEDDNTTNISRTSTSSIKPKNPYIDDIGSALPILTVGLDDTGLSLLNTPDESLEQSDLSNNQSKIFSSKRRSLDNSNDVSVKSNKSIKLENNENNSTRKSACFSEQNNQSFSNDVSKSLNITDRLQDTGLSLFIATGESLEQSDLSINQLNRSSKRCLQYNSSDDETVKSDKLLKLKDNTNNGSKISVHSSKLKNQSSNNEGSTSLIISDELQNTEGLTQLNNTVGTLEHSNLSINQLNRTSKRRLRNNSTGESVTLDKSLGRKDSTNNSSKISVHSSKLKNQASNNEGSTSLITEELQNTECPTQLNRSSKRRLRNNSTGETVTLDKSLRQKDNTNNSSKISVHSSKLKNQASNNEGSTSLIISDELQNTEGLTQLNNTIETLEHGDLSINQLNRSSKRRLRNNSMGESVTLDKSLRQKDNTNNSSKISVHSSKLKNQASNNEGSTSLIISDELQNTEGLTQLNNTIETLEHGDLSINQLNRSSKRRLRNNSTGETVTLDKSLRRKDNTNNSSKISVHSSKLKNQASNNEGSTSLIISDELQNTEGLTQLNNTIETLEHGDLSINQLNRSSKRRLRNNSMGESVTLDKSLRQKDNTNNSSKISVHSSKLKNQASNNEGSTSLIISDELQNTEGLTQLNNTIETLEHGDLSINQLNRSSKRRLRNNSTGETVTLDKSLRRKDNTNNSSKISVHSSKLKNQASNNEGSTSLIISDELQNTEGLTQLNNTIETLEHGDLSINQLNRSSKRRLRNNSTGESVTLDKSLRRKDNTNNSSKISVHSSKLKNQASNNEGSTSLIISDELQNTEGLTQLNNTVGTLKQKDKSMYQTSGSTSKHSLLVNTKDESVTSNKSLKQNDKRRMSDRLSARKNQSVGNVEPSVSNITNSVQSKKQSLLSKTLKKNHIKTNDMPIASTSSVNSVGNSKNKGVNLEAEDSVFWSTVSESSTNTSRTIPNVNSKSNQLIVIEQIESAIENMSINQITSNHPGAFVIDDSTNRPLTRSSVKRPTNSSPSILTRVLAGNDSFESTFSEISLSSNNIDHTVLEEHVKEKYRSLYSKETWVTKRLYCFLVCNLQPRFNIYSMKCAEKFVMYLKTILKQIYKDKNADLQLFSDMLRYHMARYGIIKTTADYLGFLTDYIPRPYYDKLVPGWNHETSAVKFDDQKYFIPIMEDETFLNKILEHIRTV